MNCICHKYQTVHLLHRRHFHLPTLLEAMVVPVSKSLPVHVNRYMLIDHMQVAAHGKSLFSNGCQLNIARGKQNLKGNLCANKHTNLQMWIPLKSMGDESTCMKRS